MILNKKNILIEDTIIKIIFSNCDLDLTKVDIEKLVKVADSHLITTLFYSKIVEKKLLNFFDSGIKNFLQNIYIENVKRNKILKKETRIISNIFKKNNINHCFLKGTALLFGDYYKNIGDRLVGDIDVLILEKDAKKAISLLKSLKYYDQHNYMFFGQRHYPRLMHKKKIFALEVHFKIINKKNSQQIIKSNDILESKVLKNDIFIPSVEFLQKHCVINNIINDMGMVKSSYNFRAIYDIYLLNLIKRIDFNKKRPYSFFFIYTDYKKITKLKEKFSFIDKLIIFRIKLKRGNNIYNKADYFITKGYLNFRFRINQIFEILINKKYRKYIIQKILGSK